MAAVYEGRRVGLERRVAIKILRPELAENESNVRRFLREAKAASAISHPNVVSIEVTRAGKVRRAKLYYMKGRHGKSARIKEKLS